MQRFAFPAICFAVMILATLTAWNIYQDRDLAKLKEAQDVQAARLEALERKLLEKPPVSKTKKAVRK